MQRRIGILLLAIGLLSFLLRFYKLGIFPPGLYWDEVSIAYNAYSILKTGKDEYGKQYPFWFEAFGEYKLPLYIYLTVPSIFFFGQNATAVRLISAIASSLSPLILILLVRVFFQSYPCLQRFINGDKLSLISGFCLAISPWHIHFGRAAFEATLALFLVLVGIWFWFLSIAKQSKYLLFLGLLSLAASLYTYNAERIFVPLLLLLLTFMGRVQLRFISKKQSILIIVILMMILLPFISFAVSKEGLTRGLSESFTTEIKAQPDSSIISTVNLYLTAWSKNFISYLSVDYLFFWGDFAGRHSVREMGLLYLWQLPIVLIGLVTIWKQSKHLCAFLLLWLFISILPASIAKPSPHALRSLLMIIPLTFMASFGLLQAAQLITSSKRIIFVIFLTLPIIYGLFFYLHIYYIHYVKRAAFDWQDGYVQLISAIKKYVNDVDYVIVTKDYGQPYLYFLFYLPYDPAKYLSQKASSDAFAKFIFVTSPYPGKPPPNSLYAASPWENPTGKNVENITMTNGEVIFRLWKN